MATVEIRLVPSRVNSVIGDQVTAACAKAAHVSEERMRGFIESSGRIDTSAMLNSVTTTHTDRTPLHPVFEVGAYTPYAYYQEHGIGPVFPLRAAFLRFIPKGGTTVVFARQTAGFAGAHFAADTARALRPSDYV